MAFNLNKNDGSAESSNSKSKFDLSKNDAPIAGTDVHEKKSKALPYVLIGLLIVVVGGWYFLSNKRPEAANVDEVASTTQMDSITSASALNNDSVVVPANAADGSSDINPSSEVKNKSEAAVAKEISSFKNKIPVSFARGATAFRNIDQSIVDDIVKYLASNSSAKLEVRGYASSEGSFEANQSISQARADAFKSYLVSRNVSEDRITAVGKGIEDPVASNNTESGRRKNRRVEITTL